MTSHLLSYPPAVGGHFFGGCRNAARGSTRLYVSNTAMFNTNSWMRLLMDNVNNTLLADLNGQLTQPEAAQNNRADLVQFNFRVTQVC